MTCKPQRIVFVKNLAQLVFYLIVMIVYQCEYACFQYTLNMMKNVF